MSEKCNQHNATYVHPESRAGGIKIGHPICMSGARLIGRVALDLVNRSEKLSIAALCLGVDLVRTDSIRVNYSNFGGSHYVH